MLVGYLYIRATDAIRHEIHYENNKYFALCTGAYKGKKIIINYNLSGSTNNVIILDKSINYADYERNAKDGFKKITINGIEVDNNNIININ
jgi:hypothetical protein